MSIELQLEDEEMDVLLMAVGYAIGVALREGERGIASKFLTIANRIGESVPGWQPYKVLLEKDPEQTALS